MTQTIMGLIAFLLGGGAVLAGFALGLWAARRNTETKNSSRAGDAPIAESVPAGDTDRERKELEDEQKAFRLLTGYSAEVAYGRESL